MTDFCLFIYLFMLTLWGEFMVEHYNEKYLYRIFMTGKYTAGRLPKQLSGEH